MRKYTIGFICGVLYGWDVVKDGETICYAPYVWSSTKEIECD